MPHVARHGNTAFPADNTNERDEDSFNGVKEEARNSPENLSGQKVNVASLSDNQVSDEWWLE